MSSTTNNSEQHQEVTHEINLYAEPILNIGGFSITNSYINSLLAVFILIILFLAAGRKAKLIPKGMQNFFEIILDGAMGFADSITQDRKKTEKLLPIVLPLFLFILVNNWLGILPGIGTIGFIQDGHLIPFFRGGTADLNTTLALALFAIVMSHIMGVITVGLWKHSNKFINFQAMLDIPRKFSKDKTVTFVHPIKFGVGILEILSEVAKVVSLSLRLFGNIFAGEILISSMTMLFAYVLPVPFYFMEVLVGVVQAAVFAILALVFMTITMSAEEH